MRKSPVLTSIFAFVIGLSAPVLATDDFVGLELVAVDAEWRYYDDAVFPGDFWMGTDFDDSAWESGLAELGFGDFGSSIATTQLTRGPITFYFRRDFTVSQADLDSLEAEDSLYQIAVSLLRDDGAVVYINGIELMRSNMDEFVDDTHEQLAASSVGGDTEEFFFDTVHDGTGYLHEGENVVAVSIHQGSASSSDISFNMAMTAHDLAPQFGAFIPPQRIDFDDPSVGAVTFFEPDPGQGHTNLGWYAMPSGSPVSYGARNTDANDPSLPIYPDGYAFRVNEGRASMVTQNDDVVDNALRYRIDLRNYVDVEVAFSVRCYDLDYSEPGSANGFETSDFFRFYHLTSDDGINFVRTEVMELIGGGGGSSSAVGTLLVTEDSPKRALVPTDDSLGMAWTGIGFDDTTWHSFSDGGIGYDVSISNTTYDQHIGFDTETLMNDVNTSCYMRIPFEVADVSVFDSLVLSTRDDDGFIAYLNGVEVAALNRPASPAWDSNATGNNSDVNAVQLKDTNITSNLGDLVNGTNILAIHGLNAELGSSDFLVSVTLRGIGVEESPRLDPPETLDDINFGPQGVFYRYEFPVPDAANSYTFEVELSANDRSETLMFDNFSITGTPVSVDSYDAWVQLSTGLDPEESGERLSDPDSDQIANFLEFAFGSDPETAQTTSAAGTPLLPRARVVEENGLHHFELTWRQLDVPTTGGLDFPIGGFLVYDIKYIPQFSLDGVIWEDGESEFQGEMVGGFVDNGDGTVDVTMRYRDPIAIAGGDRVLLGRIKVEQTVPFLE